MSVDYMTKGFTILGMILLTAAFGAAQPAQADIGPGWVGPDSALYGLETAWDNAMMGIGLKDQGAVAQERAAEARAMAEKNNTDGMERAISNLNRIAQRAGSDNTEGLEKAAAVIQGIKDRAPQQAQQGLQTALETMQNAGAQLPDQAREARNQGHGKEQNDTGAPVQQINVTERINEAMQLREQGRQAIREGNDRLDQNAFQDARQEYGDARDRFRQAAERIQDVETDEAVELEEQLAHSLTGVQQLRESVQAYMDGNNETARTAAQDAQDSFNLVRGDTQ